MPKKRSEQGAIIDYCYTHPLPEVESLRAIIDNAIRARRRREGKPTASKKAALAHDDKFTNCFETGCTPELNPPHWVRVRKPREKKQAGLNTLAGSAGAPTGSPPVHVLAPGCQLPAHALCTHAGGGRASA